MNSKILNTDWLKKRVLSPPISAEYDNDESHEARLSRVVGDILDAAPWRDDLVIGHCHLNGPKAPFCGPLG